MAELTEKDTLKVVNALAAFDPKVKEEFEKGNLEFVPRIKDSLELSDAEIEIEVALDLFTDAFDPWRNLKVGASLKEIFTAAAEVQEHTSA